MTALKVGVVFDSGGRGDRSFNDSAYAGIERAQKEFGIEVLTVESRKDSDFQTNIQGMADQGCGLVFAVGFAQSTPLAAVAPGQPNTKFAIIDAVVEAPNVRSLTFAEEQGSFLAGYLAGLTSKSGKVGFVGGKEIPLIEKFEAGYMAGAKFARPDLQVLAPRYTNSWNDTNLGKAAAEVLYREGADVVYHAAGRSGLGVISAAKDAGKLAIGVDSDQDEVAPGFVLTSMIKRVDEAVYQTIKDTVNGAFTPGLKVYDLAGNGVGLTEFVHTKDKIDPDHLTRLNEVADRVRAGELKIPSKKADVDAFLASAQ